MNISQLDNKSTAINFNGTIKMNRNYPRRFKDAFRNNPEVQRLAEGDYTIIPKLKHKQAGMWDMNHSLGEDLYQLSISAKKEKPSLIERMKYAFGKAPKVDVTHSFHSLSSIINIMSKRINADSYNSKLLR